MVAILTIIAIIFTFYAPYYLRKKTDKIKELKVRNDIKFAEKIKDGAGNYDIMENPDTTNGNIKFVFEYKSKTKTIK